MARAIATDNVVRLGERYREGQEDQLGALGLVTNAVVLWNTLYMQEERCHIFANRETPEEEHLARLSPDTWPYKYAGGIIRFRYQKIF